MNPTQESIVMAARAVLIQEGSNNFSMRKVAAEAGIRLSNLQYYYKTKTDLIGALLVSYLKEYKSSLTQSLSNDESGKAALQSFVQNVIFEESDADEIKLSVALTSFAEQEEFKSQLDSLYDDLHDLLIDFLAKISGKNRDELCIQQAIAVLLPFINGYGLVSKNLSLSPIATSEFLTNVVWLNITGAQ